MFKNLITFFDRLEDKIRNRLSTRPILYAIVASLGTVLLWRGIWETADSVGLPGYVSMILGIVILLLIGVFVSSFVGNRLILTGMRNEKKFTEKTKKEIENDLTLENETLNNIDRSLEEIKEEIISLKNK